MKIIITDENSLNKQRKMGLKHERRKDMLIINVPMKSEEKFQGV